MKDSNVLIAEFMGWNIKSPTTIPTNLHLSNLELDNGEVMELQFQESWDWLRPVVEEIHTHGCEIVISSNGVTTIYSDKGKVLAEEDSEADDHMHDATYKAVVKYIKEHWAILGGTAQ